MAMTQIGSPEVASGASDVIFDSNINSTYKTYIFKIHTMHPSSSGVKFEFQANVSGASGYNEAMITTYFRTYSTDDGVGRAFGFSTGDAQSGTAFQPLSHGTCSGSTCATSGELWLFNPSNTYYVKHFHSRFSQMGNTAIQDDYAAGFFDVTGAINAVKFQTTSGTFDGTITMYGMGE